MFFQLPEIERIQARTHQLGKQKDELESTITRAYSSHNKVQVSVNVTIEDIIEKAKKYLKIITNIEDQAENGFLVPSQIDVADLVYDQAHLPEWFEFVFQKQFTKQKKHFDVTSKKLYSQQSLSQKKNQLAREIKLFETLYGRYKALEQSQKVCLNIMGEAETLKNRADNIINKFLSYLLLVSSKINLFVEQNVEKSLNYSNKTKPQADLQPPLRRVPYQLPEQLFFDRISQKYNIARNQQAYTKTYQTNPTLPEFYPTRDRDPVRNGNSRLTRSPHYPPTHEFGGCNHHHQSMKSVGFKDSRFNYREHLPRWMNKTLVDYYF